MALAAGTYAVFSTTEGKITVRLFEADAPITVKNFIDLAEGKREWTHPSTHAKSTSKLYDGTIFHRVIPDFMIQGGDPAGTGMGGPGYRFEDDGLVGLVLSAAGDEGDFGDDLLALDDFAEDGVVAGEPGRGGDSDEELAAVGSGAGVGHGQLA